MISAGRFPKCENAPFRVAVTAIAITVAFVHHSPMSNALSSSVWCCLRVRLKLTPVSFYIDGVQNGVFKVPIIPRLRVPTNGGLSVVYSRKRLTSRYQHSEGCTVSLTWNCPGLPPIVIYASTAAIGRKYSHFVVSQSWTASTDCCVRSCHDVTRKMRCILSLTE
jgi:hypothetical protein